MEVEQVLAVPTAVLQAAGLFQGLSTDVDHYLRHILDPARLAFLPRPAAELDPSFKQIIPYVVLRHGDAVFHYLRGQGGGEKRLRALRSVGVGGHINPCDQDKENRDTAVRHADPNVASRGAAADHPYRRGMLREVAEEVFVDTPYRERCLGLINDDATPVGRVHLGIVHVFDLDEPRVRRREQDLAEAGFARIGELLERKGEFETWSQFVLQAL